MALDFFHREQHSSRLDSPQYDKVLNEHISGTMILNKYACRMFEVTLS